LNRGHKACYNSQFANICILFSLQECLLLCHDQFSSLCTNLQFLVSDELYPTIVPTTRGFHRSRLASAPRTSSITTVVPPLNGLLLRLFLSRVTQHLSPKLPSPTSHRSLNSSREYATASPMWTSHTGKSSSTASVSPAPSSRGVFLSSAGGRVTSGEVVVRGACVMMGYLKVLEGMRKCVRENGWLYTRDVGVVHGDGYLEIKDRSKDVIISRGENVSSVEVEAVMYAHPPVREAAVVGRPDEFWGETPCAFVELKERLERWLTEEEVVEFCRERMAHFMVPKTVVFKEVLPKTPKGKILKHVLRTEAQGMGSLAMRSRM